MNIEILNIAKHQPNDNAINIALPVLAIECEATPPLENYLDVYEEAVLKLVSIGLSARGIAGTLNATESLIEEILDGLDSKMYVVKEAGKPWELTEDGAKYLNGVIEERASDNSQFGYMFVNAIKKEVFPYFYQGDLNQAPLYMGAPLPAKLTLYGSEEKTFENYTPKRVWLKEAYKKYYRNSSTLKQYAEGEVSLVEAVDLFEGLDSFDEEDDIELQDHFEITSREKSNSEGNMFIRALNCPPKHVYLTMRIILDPYYPGGYRVESPFNLDGIDNSYYLRQVQWLAVAGSTFIGEENLEAFLSKEICKLVPDYKISDIDFSVFMLEKMPLLKANSNRFNRVYDDMSRIYSLMRRQKSLLEKENIVSNISRNILEALFNEFFKGIKKETLTNISKKAEEELDDYCRTEFIKQIAQSTALDPSMISWSHKYTLSAIYKLKTTKGNSIVEKFINLVVLNYYLGTNVTKSFLSSESVQQMYNLTEKLNRIRNKVSHDTDERFEPEDYEFYMANVFTLINGLLEAFKEV